MMMYGETFYGRHTAQVKTDCKFMLSTSRVKIVPADLFIKNLS